MINCKIRPYGIKFWQLVAYGYNIRCCWHCVVKASLPLHSDPIVWFSSHPQSTTESGPACLIKLTINPCAAGVQMVSWGYKICANASILYIYAAHYSNLTSSMVPNVSDVLNITWQECGLTCARLRGTWTGQQNRSTVLQLVVAPSHSPPWCLLYAL